MEIRREVKKNEITQRAILSEIEIKLKNEQKMQAYEMALRENRQIHQMAIEDKKLENERKWWWEK